MVALSNDEYCRRILQYYDADIDDDNNNNNIAAAVVTNDLSTTITPSNAIAGANDDGDQQAEAYASSASDPDYNNEGLKLLSVSEAIRKDPMRLRVTGIIDTVRKPFKLLKIVYFTCYNSKCRRLNVREKYIWVHQYFH
jgi:hypothetical protein